MQTPARPGDSGEVLAVKSLISREEPLSTTEIRICVLAQNAFLPRYTLCTSIFPNENSYGSTTLKVHYFPTDSNLWD